VLWGKYQLASGNRGAKVSRRQQTRSVFASGAVQSNGMSRQAIALVETASNGSRSKLPSRSTTQDTPDSSVHQIRLAPHSNEIRSGRLVQNGCPVYATDEEIGKILLGKKDWKTFVAIIPTLEREGLPPRRALFLYRRHLPAVLRFLERRELSAGYGMLSHEPLADDGSENFD